MLKEAAQADLEAERRSASRRHFVRRWTHRTKRLTVIVTTVTGLVTAIGAFVGAVRGYLSRDVSPADLPANGVASTALDRVEEPKKPSAK